MPDPLSDLQRLGQEFDAEVVEAVARACADDPGARLIAGKSETVCFDDMDSETQEFWRCIARAAIEAARPMIEAWMPIESAPRDGTPFLASFTCTSSGARFIVADVRWHRDHWCSDGDGIVEPTHWMPLPAPPSIEPQS